MRMIRIVGKFDHTVARIKAELENKGLPVHISTISFLKDRPGEREFLFRTGMTYNA